MVPVILVVSSPKNPPEGITSLTKIAKKMCQFPPAQSHILNETSDGNPHVKKEPPFLGICMIENPKSLCVCVFLKPLSISIYLYIYIYKIDYWWKRHIFPSPTFQLQEMVQPVTFRAAHFSVRGRDGNVGGHSGKNSEL